MFINIYLNFIVKDDKNRIFWGPTDVQTDDHFASDIVDKVTRFANITQLSQVFKLMTFKVRLITWTDGISNFTNHFKCYLDALYFSCCFQFIDCWWFCDIKLNSLIKYNNCIYRAPQSLPSIVEYHINLQEVTVCCELSVLGIIGQFSSHWSKSGYIFETSCVYICIFTQLLPTSGIWYKVSFYAEFSSSLNGCLTKDKEHSLPNYLPIAGRGRVGFIPFPERYLKFKQLCSRFELGSRCPFPTMIQSQACPHVVNI